MKHFKDSLLILPYLIYEKNKEMMYKRTLCF